MPIPISRAPSLGLRRALLLASPFPVLVSMSSPLLLFILFFFFLFALFLGNNLSRMNNVDPNIKGTLSWATASSSAGLPVSGTLFYVFSSLSSSSSSSSFLFSNECRSDIKGALSWTMLAYPSLVPAPSTFFLIPLLLLGKSFSFASSFSCTICIK